MKHVEVEIIWRIGSMYDSKQKPFYQKRSLKAPKVVTENAWLIYHFLGSNNEISLMKHDL